MDPHDDYDVPHSIGHGNGTEDDEEDLNINMNMNMNMNIEEDDHEHQHQHQHHHEEQDGGVDDHLGVPTHHLHHEHQHQDQHNHTHTDDPMGGEHENQNDNDDQNEPDMVGAIDFMESEPTLKEQNEMRRAIKPPSEWLRLICKDWAIENEQLVQATDAKLLEYKPYLKTSVMGNNQSNQHAATHAKKDTMSISKNSTDSHHSDSTTLNASTNTSSTNTNTATVTVTAVLSSQLLCRMSIPQTGRPNVDFWGILGIVDEFDKAYIIAQIERFCSLYHIRAGTQFHSEEEDHSAASANLNGSGNIRTTSTNATLSTSRTNTTNHDNNGVHVTAATAASGTPAIHGNTTTNNSNHSNTSDSNNNNNDATAAPFLDAAATAAAAAAAAAANMPFMNDAGATAAAVQAASEVSTKGLPGSQQQQEQSLLHHDSEVTKAHRLAKDAERALEQERRHNLKREQRRLSLERKAMKARERETNAIQKAAERLAREQTREARRLKKIQLRQQREQFAQEQKEAALRRAAELVASNRVPIEITRGAAAAKAAANAALGTLATVSSPPVVEQAPPPKKRRSAIIVSTASDLHQIVTHSKNLWAKYNAIAKEHNQKVNWITVAKELGIHVKVREKYARMHSRAEQRGFDFVVHGHWKIKDHPEIFLEPTQAEQKAKMPDPLPPSVTNTTATTAIGDTRVNASQPVSQQHTGVDGTTATNGTRNSATTVAMDDAVAVAAAVVDAAGVPMGSEAGTQAAMSATMEQQQEQQQEQLPHHVHASHMTDTISL